MSKIQFEQIHEDVVEVVIPSNTPIDMVNQLTKSLTARGLVEDKKNSTLGIRFFVRPETDTVNEAADKLIKSLEKLSKGNELPYWHPKAQMAHQKQQREAAIAERRAKNGTTAATPQAAPAAPGSTKPKMYDTTPQSMNTADGTGKRYAYINDPVKKEEGDEDDVEKSGYGKFKGGSQYSVADNAKRKANNIGDSIDSGPNSNVKAYSTKPGQMSGKAQADLTARIQNAANKRQPVKSWTPEQIASENTKRGLKKGWADHNSIPSAEEEIMRLAKATTQTGEEASALQLASLMMGKQMLGKDVHPAVAAMMAPPPAQPTNEQMFGAGVVTEDMAKAADQKWGNTFNNWLVEAQKPISQRFASQAEEEAYWANIKVEDRDNGGSGY